MSTACLTEGQWKVFDHLRVLNYLQITFIVITFKLYTVKLKHTLQYLYDVMFRTDYKRTLELDPSQTAARRATMVSQDCMLLTIHEL